MVQITDARKVAMDQFTLQVLGQSALFCDSFVISQLPSKLRRVGRCTFRNVLKRCERDLLTIVEVPILFRCNKRQVRTNKSNAMKNAGCSKLRMISVAGWLPVRLRHRHRSYPIYLSRLSGCAASIRIRWVIFGLIRLQSVLGCFGPIARHRPRLLIVVIPLPNVKYLTERLRLISVCLKHHRQGNSIGSRFAKIRCQIVNTERLRPQSNEQCIARRRAYRLVAIRTPELYGLGSKSIDVRSLYHRIPVASDCRLQVVNTNQEYIGFRNVRLRTGKGCCALVSAEETAAVPIMHTRVHRKETRRYISVLDFKTRMKDYGTTGVTVSGIGKMSEANRVVIRPVTDRQQRRTLHDWSVCFWVSPPSRLTTQKPLSFIHEPNIAPQPMAKNR